MQNATVDISVEVSNLTADALEVLGKSVDKPIDQIGAFLLEAGFSNLRGRGVPRRQRRFLSKQVLATQG